MTLKRENPTNKSIFREGETTIEKKNDFQTMNLFFLTTDKEIMSPNGSKIEYNDISIIV